MPRFSDRLMHAWNAFRNPRDQTLNDSATSYYTSYKPDRLRLSSGNERSIVTAVYNRIASDVAAVTINHVRLDQNGRYTETIKSGLNNALTVEANIDQTGRQLIQDVVLSMFDEGCVAIVPTDTTLDPWVTGSYDIQTLRVGQILQWKPDMVKVRVYNERTGVKEDVDLPKRMVAIVENPFYAIMNAPNSTFKRLVHKLGLLDAVDEQSSAGKLDLIIQLPYIIKSDARRAQAEQRRKEIEHQLAGSKYGIAYTDGTEKVTQLNRSVENNLMAQIEYLTKMFYSQIGITEEILMGTADEQAMLNYNSRTIEPILAAICNEINRKFLTKTARSQNQGIMFFRDPFRLVPVQNIADIADKFTRNEILSSNEVRCIIGFKPVDAEAADELRNKNLNRDSEDAAATETAVVGKSETDLGDGSAATSDVSAAKQALLKMGLDESDFDGVPDSEIIELFKAYAEQ